MTGFLKALFSATDKQVDSIIVAGLFCALALCALESYAVVLAHQAFDPLNFSSGAGLILGGIGGAKWARDGRKTDADAQQ